MDYRPQTLDELARKSGSAAEKHALVGFDGFVDRIMKAVDKRHGKGSAFTAMQRITDFGNRINAAAGESANIELFMEVEKLGGNGPIMANAVAASGIGVRYVGALGKPVHPVFADFATQTNAVSICDPGITNAVEFEDGKIMLGTMASLDHVNYPSILATMGEGAFFDAVSRADLMAFVNWTMLPNMTNLMQDILSKVLPNLGPREDGRHFFFDLADPAKRSDSDLKAVLRLLGKFRNYGAATLGLNLAEAKQVSHLLGQGDVANNGIALESAAKRICRELDLSCVVIHPREGAAAADHDDTAYVEGPFCAKPKISTGAGDHFNAGFSTAQVLGLPLGAALTVAVSTSGYYVRTAESPALGDIAGFIESWQNGTLPA